MNIKIIILYYYYPKSAQKMGIPQYFAWLQRKYPAIVSHNVSKQVDNLYFDYNCLIYHAWASLYRTKYDFLKQLSRDELEREIIAEVVKYTKYIIFDIVKPQKMVYIAMDGTVPRAKMNQQRFRRFKRDITDKMERDLKEKYGMFQEPLWDTNCITPATDFMYNLSQELEKQMKNNFGHKGGHKVQYILSDTSVAGEGEHKALNHLKTRDYGEKFVVYGLDADLIMLCLISGYNIELLRENMDKRISEAEFFIVHVKELGKGIISEFRNKLFGQELQYLAIIRDYVFLSFFVGNDFCPSLPSLNIRYNGIDFLINIYCRYYKECGNLIVKANGGAKTWEVNEYFLTKIFNSLSQSEYNNLKFLYQRRLKKIPVPYDLDAYQTEKFCQERLPLNDTLRQYYCAIDYTKPDWQQRYHKLMLDEAPIPAICAQYLSALVFTKNYYFNDIVSWEWYYPYLNAPLISDVAQYWRKTRRLIAPDLGIPYSPYEQLLMILPPHNSGLLPASLAKGMTSMESPIIEYYPETFEMHYYEKMMLYSVEPILPLIDSEKIRDFFLKNCHLLTNKEKQRNIIAQPKVIA